MVNKVHVSNTLHDLNNRFARSSSNTRDHVYYSKLALLETCGWIETTMDDIVLTCARKHIKTSNNLTHFESQIVERNSGFNYERNFRSMLVHIIGTAKVEQLEQRVDQSKFHIMKSSLGTLSQQRNQVAHTDISNMTLTIFSPTVTMNHFDKVYEGLKDYERCVKRLRS